MSNKIVVKYSVPTVNGYAAQVKIHEGEDIRHYYEDGVFVVDNMDTGTKYVYSLALMPVAEICGAYELTYNE